MKKHGKILFNRVLLKLDHVELEQKSPTGIILPKLDERLKEAIEHATVVSMGASAFKGTYEKPPIKVGDRVCYKRYAGNKANVDEKDNTQYRVVEDEDILFKLEEVE